MYEIIADPEDYSLDNLISGTGNSSSDLSNEERDKWAVEIFDFVERLNTFANKAKSLANLFSGSERIKTSPASMKTLKIQFFLINESLNRILAIVDQIESDIVKR